MESFLEFKKRSKLNRWNISEKFCSANNKKMPFPLYGFFGDAPWVAALLANKATIRFCSFASHPVLLANIPIFTSLFSAKINRRIIYAIFESAYFAVA